MSCLSVLNQSDSQLSAASPSSCKGVCNVVSSTPARHTEIKIVMSNNKYSPVYVNYAYLRFENAHCSHQITGTPNLLWVICFQQAAFSTKSRPAALVIISISPSIDAGNQTSASFQRKSIFFLTDCIVFGPVRKQRNVLMPNSYK